MGGKLSVPLFDMVMCLANVVDLVSPAVEDHHRRTACIAMNIAREMGLGQEEISRLVVAGSLHDVGALSLRQRLDALEFEAKAPERHSILGYRLLSGFGPFGDIAVIVRHHHDKWRDGSGRSARETVPLASRILRLADRVDALIDRRGNILEQAPVITKRISQGRGRLFMPDALDAFMVVADRESFWLETAFSDGITEQLRDGTGLGKVLLGPGEVMQLAEMFSSLIDFRSRYTAVHSSGVAATAEALAGLSGFTAPGRRLIRLAGYLHDIGKLAVPAEVLDKPAKLTQPEFSLIKAHTFYTFRVLSDVRAFRDVCEWAAYHHERLDGKGYPFHLRGDKLPLGSRVMSVADVFTALTEPRPYRQGMEKGKVMRIMGRMSKDGGLDGGLVETVETHYDYMETINHDAQRDARARYERFSRPIA